MKEEAWELEGSEVMSDLASLESATPPSLLHTAHLFFVAQGDASAQDILAHGVGPFDILEVTDGSIEIEFKTFANFLKLMMRIEAVDKPILRNHSLVDSPRRLSISPKLSSPT